MIDVNGTKLLGSGEAAERHGITQRHARHLARRAQEAGNAWPAILGHDYLAPIEVWDDLLREHPTRGGHPRKYRWNQSEGEANLSESAQPHLVAESASTANPVGRSAMTTAKKLMTGEELERLPSDGRRYELLDGELVEMAPNNEDHDEVRSLVTLVVGEFVVSRKLGRFFSGDTGYYLRRDPDRVRTPDLSFVAAERVSARGRRGFSSTLPDLVIEIVSPGDPAGEVEAKAQEWLAAGVRLVLVVFPDTRSVLAYRGPSDVRRYADTDTLDAEPVLPGFSCPVARFFPED